MQVRGEGKGVVEGGEVGGVFQESGAPPHPVFTHVTMPLQDARGDQCDACGNLLNPTELINPKCKFSGTKPIIR